MATSLECVGKPAPTGCPKSKTFPTKKAARAYLADVETTVNRGTYVDPHAGRITFGTFTTPPPGPKAACASYDLRHSYATWLVSRGVPVNDVQSALGHEKASTTLDLYTHRSDGRDQRIRDAFTDDPLTQPDESTPDLDDYHDPDIL